MSSPDAGSIPLALIGLGRMGRAVEALAGDRGFHIVARVDRAGGGAAITRETLGDAAVAIEFTRPEAAVENARACLAAGCPVVIGTTGWYDQLPALRTEVEERGGALLAAPNFSVGVAVFQQLAAQAAGAFARLPGFAVHLVETHHAAKRDAPSGTALALARRARDTSGRDVPITSVRVGAVPGTHEMLFDAPFELVRLVHEARDRRVFADGALLAARWLVGRRGVYAMDDVVSASFPTPP